MKIINVRAPVWVDSKKNSIRVEVMFEGLREWTPFCATVGDGSEHGKKLWEECVAGKYGPVSENYLITDQQIAEYRVESLNRKRSELLLQATAWESGVRVMKAADAEIRLNELDRYREALMRLEEQPEYPQRVKFPTPPWI